MSFVRILGFVFYAFVCLLFLGLARVEIGAWLRDRRNPAKRSAASRRFLRRGLGGVFLLLALVFLRYPNTSHLSPYLQLAKLLVCLVLCVGAFAITIWDLRVMRQEMRQEAENLVENSAQSLRQYLKEADAKARRKGRK
jgi:hypothetical protein